MKRILLNAILPDEQRLAVLDGKKLIDLDIEASHRDSIKGNIYRAQVVSLSLSVEAAFVDFGNSKHGFLPLKDINLANIGRLGPDQDASKVKIEDVLKPNHYITVQVKNNPRGNKGAALTSVIRLAGRFLVLIPNTQRGGISKKVVGKERSKLNELVDTLEIPAEHGVIARTAGIGQSQDALQQDLNYLLNLWKAIEKAAESQDQPRLIFEEEQLPIRAIRDYFQPDVEEIVIDNADVHERISKFVAQIMPDSPVKLVQYTNPIPLFSHFRIEDQIKMAFSREVRLPGGGTIVIDYTEAATVIDVNSARATKLSGIQETSLKTNLEAVAEIARQLRIRDVGGLIVIDLIDMQNTKSEHLVKQHFLECLKSDHAHIQVGSISRFGMLEMSRQRTHNALDSTTQTICPTCEGLGQIRTIPSQVIEVLRQIEIKAQPETHEMVQAVLPTDIFTYLVNEKRYELTHLEFQYSTKIVLVPSAELQYQEYKIVALTPKEMVKEGDISSTELLRSNQRKSRNDSARMLESYSQKDTPPAVVDRSHAETLRERNLTVRSSGSLWQKILQLFQGGTSASEPKVSTRRRPEPRKNHRARNHHRPRGSRGGVRRKNR